MPSFDGGDDFVWIGGPTQTQERKLTIELVKSDGEVYRLTRDDDGEVHQATRDDVMVEAEPEPTP